MYFLKSLKGQQNGADVSILDSEQTYDREPTVNLYSNKTKTLWSPSTSVCNLDEFHNELKKDISSLTNIDLITNTKFIKLLERNFDSTLSIQTSNGKVNSKYLINASGSDSLMIAQQFGFGKNYSILPLQGYYFEALLSGKAEN